MSMFCDLILKGEVYRIKEIMEISENIGMQTFDAALYRLHKAGKISLEEALRNADSQNNLRQRISMEERGNDSSLELETPPAPTAAAPAAPAPATAAPPAE